MAAIFAFKCSCCGEVHEGSPSFGYRAPTYYDHLSQTEKNSIATLSSDLCKIESAEVTDHFVRAALEIPIHGVAEPFLWGIWVSLSEESFKRYTHTWGEHDEADSYFGWFSNRLPYYPDTINLKTHVRPRRDGLRPYIELQECDHPLAIHFHRGLSVEQAQEIAEAVMHASS
jgi:hypothetical protein